jgi:hypothetical protein
MSFNGFYSLKIGGYYLGSNKTPGSKDLIRPLLFHNPPKNKKIPKNEKKFIYRQNLGGFLYFWAIFLYLRGRF